MEGKARKGVEKKNHHSLTNLESSGAKKKRESPVCWASTRNTKNEEKGGQKSKGELIEVNLSRTEEIGGKMSTQSFRWSHGTRSRKEAENSSALRGGITSGELFAGGKLDTQRSHLRGH